LNQAATISSTAPVNKLLTVEEQNLVALLSNIIVDLTLKQAYEESDQVPEIQQ
jgi:hypothetical protein